MPRKIRQIKVEGNIAYVPLTKGYEAVIDALDVPMVDGWNWCVQPSAYTFYAIRKDQKSKATIRMHRVILGIEDSSVFVDHIDRDGLNNKRANMRAASQGENNRNVKLQERSKSGFKGVTLHVESGKWRARIRHNGKLTSLGLFLAKEDAHVAYCAASARLHGEFGRVE